MFIFLKMQIFLHTIWLIFTVHPYVIESTYCQSTCFYISLSFLAHMMINVNCFTVLFMVFP